MLDSCFILCHKCASPHLLCWLPHQLGTCFCKSDLELSSIGIAHKNIETVTLLGHLIKNCLHVRTLRYTSIFLLGSVQVLIKGSFQVLTGVLYTFVKAGVPKKVHQSTFCSELKEKVCGKDDFLVRLDVRDLTKEKTFFVAQLVIWEISASTWKDHNTRKLFYIQVLLVQTGAQCLTS